MNLLEETLNELQQNSKSIEDVVAVINGNQVGTWHDFAAITDFYYCSGLDDSPEVSPSLRILFNDNSWLERYIEWWVYKTPIVVPTNPEPLTNVKSHCGGGGGGGYVS